MYVRLDAESQGGTGGVHLRVKSMTVSRLGSRKAWIGTGRAVSPFPCTNSSKNSPHLVGP